MTVKPINIGIAGVGFMGATHLRVYQRIKGVRIAAVLDRSGRVKNGALGGVAGNIQQTSALRLASTTRVVRDFDALLDDASIDVIDICTPTAMHPEQAIVALAAGKHVICEKPVATTVAEARAVVEAAARAKGFLLPAMGLRFWPGWSDLKEMVDKRTHGKVLAATFRRLSARPDWGGAASHPGGALLDLHIHDTDFVNFLFGPPEKVFATGVVGPSGAVDHVAAQYFYANGPVALAEGTWLQSGGFNMSYTVYCERATVDFDFQRGAEAMRVTRPGRPARTVKLRGEDGYNVELRHFIDCIRAGKPSSVVSAANTVTTMEICAAEEKSVRTGKIVALK